MRFLIGVLACLFAAACGGVGGGGVIYWSDSVDLEIHKLDLGSGDDAVLGKGVAPYHAKDGLFVFTSPNDLVESDDRFAQLRTIVADNPDQELSNNGFHNPQVSPDGKRVAYASNDNLVFVANRADGAIVARLIPPGGSTAGFYRPTWTPDGRLVMGGGYANPGLFLTDAALANPTRFDPNLAQPGYPAVSPDGKRVVCVIDKKLWLLGIDGSGLTALRAEEDEVRFPTWSPDGKQLAYFAAGRMKIIPADGGDPTDLFDKFPALADKILVFGTSDQFFWE